MGFVIQEIDQRALVESVIGESMERLPTYSQPQAIDEISESLDSNDRWRSWARIAAIAKQQMLRRVATQFASELDDCSDDED